MGNAARTHGGATVNHQTFDSLVSIDHNRTIELRDALHTEVVCVRGCLWMHRDRLGDGQLLQPGDSRCIGPEGRTLLTALAPSLMCVLGSSGQQTLLSDAVGGSHEDLLR